MKRPCKLCWLILGLFLVGNLVLLSIWWFDDDDRSYTRDKKYSHDERRTRMRHHLSDKIDVDDEQFDEMYSLWKEHGKGMKIYQNEQDSLRRALMNETFTVEIEEAKVSRLLDELATKQRQVEAANYHHFRRMRQVCKTDEQREMLDRMFRSYIEKRGPEKRRRGRRSR